MSKTFALETGKSGKTVIGADAERIPATVISIDSTSEPRLRFDRTALGFVARLQKALTESIPNRKTVAVTCTAPIRQDSKTSKALEPVIAQMIASRKTSLETTIFSNRIQVRVLKGGGKGSLIGFIHNPLPSPEVLFDLTRAVLRSIDSRGPHPRGDHALVVRNKGGCVPTRALEHICALLFAGSAFSRIFVAASDGLLPLTVAPHNDDY